jgi:RNA polymerase sigma factor (TIGR02999 family)
MEPRDPQTPAPVLPDELVSTLYSELRRLARMYLRNERRNHTLQPTALVHEAYLKLLQQHKVDWQNEAQVLGLAATLMRRVLASHAQRRNAQKREGGLRQVTLSLVESMANQSPTDFLEIDHLLSELQSLDARQGRVAELRLFAGLSSSQLAEVLSISPATADRDWASAKLWLARELRRGAVSAAIK